jgi:hypothetical protein
MMSLESVIDIKYVSGDESVTNRKEYKEYFLVDKMVGG